MLDPRDVESLVERARRGDADAFSILAAAFLRAAYAVALGVVRRPADAEDVAQESMMTAFERLDECREPARFGGWLLQIARRRALTWVERRGRREGEGEGARPEETATEPATGDVALRARLLGALEALTSTQRDVLLLHDLDGWTHAELGEALGITENNARQHLFQARRALRARLGDLAP